MINKIKVGERIAVIRKQLGYSQAVFAEKLNVSTQAVSKWETGLALPEVEILLNISWMGKISINNILEGEDFSQDSFGIDRSFFKLNNFLICPTCKSPLKLNFQNPNELFYSCDNGHKYYVRDGVVDFGTREIPGELWSLTFRNYDHYLNEQHYGESSNPNYHRGLSANELRWEEIEKIKPGIILEIACGTGRAIKHIIKRANWPLTVIMIDISHRILKYNWTFFSDEWKNPFVDMIYLACDGANMPIRNESVDMVCSNAGFESMQDKMMDGFRESHRVLKPDGHVIYTLCAVEDFESENTKKWIDLFLALPSSYHVNMDNTHDVKQWLGKCRQNGFSENKITQIYGELPAPDGDEFPFENEILQWMAEYLVISKK